MDFAQFKDNVFKYLCPPGNGVFTVHTAKENKESLHTKLYNTHDIKEVEKFWQQSYEQLESISKPCLLGVTSDTGGGIQRGANWGPLFIRQSLDPSQFFDLGDIKTIPHLLHDKYLNEETLQSCREALYQDNTKLPVSALSIAEDMCQNFYELFTDKAVIGLGGDHSVSYSLVKPWIKAKRAQGKKVAVIHFDAHTDLMVKRLGIDVCFASWAYHMLEELASPSHLVQFGIRSSGQNKDYWESKLGVKQYWADEILKNEKSILDETIKNLKEDNIEEIYISFDIDALDAKFASATGTPEYEGLTPEICTNYILELGKHFKVTGADLVEVAPFVKSTHAFADIHEPEQTLMSSQKVINSFVEVMK